MNLWYPDLYAVNDKLCLNFQRGGWSPTYCTSIHPIFSTSNPEFEAGPVHGSSPWVVAIAVKMGTSELCTFKRAWMQMMSAGYNLGRSRGSTAWNLRNTNMVRTVHRRQKHRGHCGYAGIPLPAVSFLFSDWNQAGTLGPSLGLSIHESRGFPKGLHCFMKTNRPAPLRFSTATNRLHRKA